jgi:hypothetical protein
MASSRLPAFTKAMMRSAQVRTVATRTSDSALYDRQPTISTGPETHNGKDLAFVDADVVSGQDGRATGDRRVGFPD